MFLNYDKLYKKLSKKFSLMNESLYLGREGIEGKDSKEIELTNPVPRPGNSLYLNKIVDEKLKNFEKEKGPDAYSFVVLSDKNPHSPQDLMTTISHYYPYGIFAYNIENFKKYLRRGNLLNSKEKFKYVVFINCNTTLDESWVAVSQTEDVVNELLQNMGYENYDVADLADKIVKILDYPFFDFQGKRNGELSDSDLFTILAVDPKKLESGQVGNVYFTPHQQRQNWLRAGYKVVSKSDGFDSDRLINFVILDPTVVEIREVIPLT